MKTQPMPCTNNPLNVPKIASRAYWELSGTSERITFEIDHSQSWSMPRAHLISVYRGSHPENSPWSLPEAGHAPSETVITFSFLLREIVVQTDYPEELLEAVLSGRISVLARGEASLRDTLMVPLQTPPSDYAKCNACVRTGHIRLL